jgi:hypothetical protein
MKRINLLLCLCGAVLISGCSSNKVPDGPPLARVTQWYEHPDYQWGDKETLQEWLNTPTPLITAYNPNNRWPNGMAASMTPFMVDWEHSTWNAADKAVQTNTYVIVKNAYIEGNPIIGQVELATIRIPEGAVKAVEFVIVRYSLKGFAKTGGHVQLRFIFDENNRPQVLNSDGSLNNDKPYLDDLFISWEAWRPTQDAFTFKQGFRMGDYRLTPRMYSGSQRFLQDLLRGAVWDCYPLDLTKAEHMGDTILGSGLLLGDGIARKQIGEIIESELAAESAAEIQTSWNKQDQNRALRMVGIEGIPDSPIKPFIEEVNPGYQILQQSCINAALKQINLAMKYLYQEQNLGPWVGIDVSPKKIPQWFDDVNEGNTWGSIYNAPYALFWFLGHKEIMPYKAYIPLKNAGLLELDKHGKPVFFRYGLKESSPYGPLKDRIM